LKLILVLNKLDLESTRQITNDEINEYLKNNKNIDNQKISLKRGDNLKELIKKINAAVNGAKNQLPVNIISEALVKNTNSINIKENFHIILIGDSTVGKVYFLESYFKNKFNQNFISTIGIDKEIKFIKLGNDFYKITLWDTTGQDRFKCLPKKYYHNSDGILLLFDVTNEDTFYNNRKWVKDIKDNLNINSEDRQDSEKPLYLIGNNIDLPGRVVSKEKAEEQAKSFGMKYFEVSCKINMNIPEVMARLIIECHIKKNHKDNCILLNSKSSEREKKSCYGGKKEKKKK
jgi:small GTP-binding protein